VGFLGAQPPSVKGLRLIELTAMASKASSSSAAYPVDINVDCTAVFASRFRDLTDRLADDHQIQTPFI
jgi:hypothetical protein